MPSGCLALPMPPSLHSCAAIGTRASALASLYVVNTDLERRASAALAPLLAAAGGRYAASGLELDGPL